MISVFTEHITPRLNYVLDFCFLQKGFEYTLYTNAIEFEKVRGIKLSYSAKDRPADFTIIPHTLLSETTVVDHSISVIEDEILIDGKSDYLSVIFWMLTRYEEYLPHKRDSHDRYLSSESQLVKNNIHRLPNADILVKKIWENLRLDYSIIQKRAECVPSFDIDVAWAYKNRNFLRTIGAAFKGKDLKSRIKVLSGKAKDPYDTYEYIHEVASRVNRIICFVLLADWSKYNKNIDWKNLEYGTLIRGLNSIGGMGIHPSYETYKNGEILEKEISRLEQIVGHEIVKSRQHFLRMEIPSTYELLISKGIQRDYTMGWADEIGFRAGTSFPHYFFNLHTNEKNNLLIFPFAYMDGAMKDQLKMTPEEAINEVEKMATAVKDVGGVLMCIWHNSSVIDQGEWQGWRKVLDATINFFPKNDFSENEFLY